MSPGQQIRWIHNGNRLDRQSKFVKIGDGELTIRVKKKRRHEGQIGRYQCVAGMKNRLLMSPPATLSVASLGEFPERSALPDTITANVGNTVMISCEVPESNPPAIIQWQRGPFTNLTGTPVNTSAEGISVVSSGALLLQVLIWCLSEISFTPLHRTSKRSRRAATPVRRPTP